jgi:hypothetical protein
MNKKSVPPAHRRGKFVDNRKENPHGQEWFVCIQPS